MDMDFWETNCVGHAPPEIIRRYRKPDAVHSVEEMVEARAELFEAAIACVRHQEFTHTRAVLTLDAGSC